VRILLAALLLAPFARAAEPPPAAQMHACLDGDASACNRVGERHVLGLGMSKDPAQAFDYLQRSCELGFLPGCSNLGLLYLTGVDDAGSKRDPERGARLIARACEGLLDVDTCPLAADLFERGGRGVKVRKDLARRYYSLSCSRGREESCAEIKLFKDKP
jgi:TPR repeat protein